jgi:hypothetical protein
LELNKITLAKWVDKVLQQYYKNETIKSRYRVCGIWPLNYVSMVKKFGSSEVFTAIEEEDLINSYHSNTIVQK